MNAYVPIGATLTLPFIWWGLYLYDQRLGMGFSGLFFLIFGLGMVGSIIGYDAQQRRKKAKEKYDKAVADRAALIKQMQPPTPTYDLLSPLEKERIDHEASETLYNVFNAIHNNTGWCGDLDPECWKAGIPVITETMAKLVMSYRQSR